MLPRLLQPICVRAERCFRTKESVEWQRHIYIFSKLMWKVIQVCEAHGLPGKQEACGIGLANDAAMLFFQINTWAF